MDTKLTTVKLLKSIYSNFKKVSFDSNMTLQRLVNRTMHRYTTDTTYRAEMDGYTELHQSGSNF